MAKRGRSFTTRNRLSFGCDDPANAMAIEEKLGQYSGSIANLAAEANAYNCLTVGPGTTFILNDYDPDTTAVRVELIKPTFQLGKGRISALWFAPQVFEGRVTAR